MYTDQERFISWLKREGHYPTVQSCYKSFLPVYREMLQTTSRDEALIISDLGERGRHAAPMTAGCYLMAARKLGIRSKLVIQSPKQTKEAAYNKVVQALATFQEDNVINLCLSGKLGSMKGLGKSFRRLVRSRHYRFTSTMNLAELPTKRFTSLIKGVDADLSSMQRTGRDIQRKLTAAGEVRIRTPAGTSLWMSVRGMSGISNDGRYADHGGNVPTGEVYIPPRRDQVEGKVVLDGSMKTLKGTRILRKPVILEIEKGSVVRIRGDPHCAEELRDTLRWAARASRNNWGVYRIGELGIGINPNVGISGPTVINEKSKGTAHVAIGSNAWFGGSIYAIIHLDQVFRNPEIFVDGKKLVY